MSSFLNRQYPWGLCNIENPEHSDFVLLQSLLGGHICHEAIQLTHFSYKTYFKEQKTVQKESMEKEKNKKVGAIIAVTLMGAFLTLGKKVLS